MKNILAVDIGGTNIKYALWKDKLAKVREVKTPREGLEELLETVEGLVSESKADALALSMPGFIDTERGIALTGGALDYISDLKVV